MMKDVVVPTLFYFIAISLSFILIDKFNVMDFMTFIPQDQKLAYGVGLYNIILNSILGFLQKKIEDNKLKIEVIFYKKEDEPNIDYNPTLKMDNELNKINIQVLVEGKTKRLKGKFIKIPREQFVTMQELKRKSNGKISKIDNEGSYIIELDKLFLDKDKKYINTKVNLGIAFLSADEQFDFLVEPLLINSSYLDKNMIYFSSNKFNIRKS